VPADELAKTVPQFEIAKKNALGKKYVKLDGGKFKHNE
jgi:hypothetical protein